MDKNQISKELLENYYWKKGYSLSQISKLFGMKSRDGIRWHMVKYNIPRRPSDRKNYVRFRFSGDLNEKSYLIGLRTGDLHARKHSRLIVVETTSPRDAQLTMFKKAFDKYAKVIVKERKGGYTEKTNRIYCHLDSSFKFLLNKPEFIPSWILKNDNLFYFFLAGYCDSEASWIITRHKKYDGKYKDLIFSLGTCDKTILEQTNQKLKELGFRSHLYMVRKKGIYRERICNFDLYRVMITHIKDIIKLAKILLPLSLHEEKRDKMQKIIKLEPLFKRALSLEIPCPACKHRKLWKLGFLQYGNRSQRYVCPNCEKYFYEDKLSAHLGNLDWLRNKEMVK